MAKIVDPDQLSQATEIDFDIPNKEIQLNIAGNLNDTAPGRSSGVTHQAIYSFAKEEWLADTDLQPIRFPFDPIFEAKFDWINSWKPADDQTIDLIRDGGFRVVLTDDEYASIISLQSFDNPASDLAYYWQVSGFTAAVTNFDKTGELNEPVLIFDGTTDYRDFLKVALRVQGKTYGEGNLLVDQDLAELTYQAYRLPLANAVDPNIVTDDSTISSSTPYTNMRLSFIKGSGFTTWANSTVYAAGAVVLDPIRQSGGSSNGTWWFTPAGGTSSGTGTANDTGVTDWEAYVGAEQIGNEWYAFNRIIDTSTGTATAVQFYEWAQYQLRLTGNINDNSLGSPNQNAYGTVNGKVARLLMDYVGTQLVTKPGVLIRDFDPNDTNSITFSDITVGGGGVSSEGVPLTSTPRNYPFVAAGNLSFSATLNDEPNADTIYKMFFQYTTRDTATDVAMTSASGATGTLTSTAINFTTHFANNDYVTVSGFAAPANNGVYQVNGAPSSGSMAVRKVNGQTLTNATAGPTINLDANPYDTPDAIVVNNNAGSPITGQVTALTVSFDYDYDGNVQGGRTAATDAPVAVMAIGKAGAQWIDGFFTITRAVGLNFPVNAATERVYLNP